MISGQVKVKRAPSSPIELNGSGSILASIIGEFLLQREFLQEDFQRRPLKIEGGSHRVEDLKELLYDLDILEMLQNTASETIQVWMRPSGEGANKLISTIATDAEQAYKLYKAGHSIYCRAPRELEVYVIPRMLKELGHGILNPGHDRYSRGEIETFFSRKGHLTDFHTDFQENFSIQLSGCKKWSFRDSTAVAPIRGCTPHYSGAEVPRDVPEQQIKVLRLGDSTFSASQYLTPESQGAVKRPLQEASACKKGSHKKSRRGVAEKQKLKEDNDLYEVLLNPGDVLYHPAGVWHRVECLEDSITINISLIAVSYAEIICSGLQQLMWRNHKWRSPVSVLDPTVALETAQEILNRLPVMLKSLNAADLLPYPSINPLSTSQKHVVFGDDDDDDDDDKYTDNDDDNDKSNVIIVGEISLPGWETDISKFEFRPNPLAEVLSEDDLDHLGWNKSVNTPKDMKAYIIHSGFGNESLESVSRCTLLVPKRYQTSFLDFLIYLKSLKIAETVNGSRFTIHDLQPKPRKDSSNTTGKSSRAESKRDITSSCRYDKNTSFVVMSAVATGLITRLT